jgi:predicted molibdopterin-dependent oxidoreductase YjgC
MTNSFREIEQAKVIFALGNLIEENNPIIATAMRRACRTHGHRLITLTSVEMPLGEFAEPPLIIPKDSNLEFLQSLVKLVLELRLLDDEFVSTHTKGIGELEKSLAHLNHLDVLAQVGMLPSTFEEIVRILANADSLAIVFSEDLTADGQGAARVETILNLAMLTGRIGQPHSGIYPLYRQINAQGAMDMGLTPTHYPGHIGVADHRENDLFSRLWGGDLPAKAGLGYREIIASAHQKEVGGLYLMGEDPIATEPERERIHEALNLVEFLVVQDIKLTQSAQLADVVLPCTALTEQEGTLTNIERRVQKAAVAAPGGPLPDWRILAGLLAKLDPTATYDDAKSVFQEIMSVVSFYQGLSYDRLEKGGLQWPNSQSDSNGMLTLADLKNPLEFAVQL